MLSTNIFVPIRNSRMQMNEVYFWTDTIKDWRSLLKQDKYKQIIVNSLHELVERKKIVVYAFVIMPNHLHLVWKLIDKNGKEMPHASFNKFTAHQIVEDLKKHHTKVLSLFEVEETERKHRIWQSDPLAVLMDTLKKVEQKINYIHTNPLQEKWNLADRPENYHWSSAKYYETGKDDFGFLTNFNEAF